MCIGVIIQLRLDRSMLSLSSRNYLFLLGYSYLNMITTTQISLHLGLFLIGLNNKYEAELQLCLTYFVPLRPPRYKEILTYDTYGMLNAINT
jgi:hypothetical protein